MTETMIPEEPVAPTRGELRAAIFKSVPQKKKVIEFRGQMIEIRQPKLADILEAQNEPDRTKGVIDTLIRYAYVPGSEEKVFEEADADSFREMAFGKDFINVNQALEELTDVNFLPTNNASGSPPNSE